MNDDVSCVLVTEMKTKNKELIDDIESQLAILKNSDEIKGYVLAILPEEDGDPLIAANASSLEVFGLSQAIIQHHINQTKDGR